MKTLMSGVIILITVVVLVVVCLLQPVQETQQCEPVYDVNNDGTVNYLDSVTVSSHINSGEPYNAAYDMNCDDVIDQTDVDIIWENRDV